MAVNKSEYVSFYSHLAGAVASIIGLFALIIQSWGSVPHVIVSIIYGLCAIFLYTCSALYHGRKQTENALTKVRKLDHIAIFFMIAGTYTPISYIYLDGYWRWSIIGVQWLLVCLGLFFKIFYLRAPRWLNTLIYILMGWMALIPLAQFIQTMPFSSIVLLFAGGVAYSVGALFYALKKPNPMPGFFGFHEIFHLLILMGTILHFAVVFTAVSV